MQTTYLSTNLLTLPCEHSNAPTRLYINLTVTLFSSPACKLNVHKRCYKNVANNCGVNSKEMAQILKDMGLTGNKLSESMRVKKVCKLEHDELIVVHPTSVKFKPKK